MTKSIINHRSNAKFILNNFHQFTSFFHLTSPTRVFSLPNSQIDIEIETEIENKSLISKICLLNVTKYRQLGRSQLCHIHFHIVTISSSSLSLTAPTPFSNYFSYLTPSIDDNDYLIIGKCRSLYFEIVASKSIFRFILLLNQIDKLHPILSFALFSSFLISSL